MSTIKPTDSLQSRLDKSADTKLAMVVDRAMQPIERLLNGNNITLVVRVSGTNTTAETLSSNVLVALEAAITEMHRHHYRQAETADFMAKVERLAGTADAAAKERS